MCRCSCTKWGNGREILVGSSLLDAAKTHTFSSVEAALSIPKTWRGIKLRIEHSESGPQSSLSNPTSLLRFCPTGNVSETLPFPLYFGDHLSFLADLSSDFLSHTKHIGLPKFLTRQKHFSLFWCKAVQLLRSQHTQGFSTPTHKALYSVVRTERTVYPISKP